MKMTGSQVNYNILKQEKQPRGCEVADPFYYWLVS